MSRPSKTRLNQKDNVRDHNTCRAVVDSLEPRRLLSVNLLKDINSIDQPAQNAYGNQEIIASGGSIYFRADDGIYGPELWTFKHSASGATSAPVMLKDIDPGVFNDTSSTSYNDGTNVGPTRLTDVNGTLFFTEDDDVHGIELWKTDGTSAGDGIGQGYQFRLRVVGSG